ncbi:MAG: hypothetical protein HQL56_11535 [Magnetococcales bacterium]|nr:hypothetical protein [Magnetococcales bacterium]
MAKRPFSNSLSKLESSVFDRTDSDEEEISERPYNLAYGGILLAMMLAIHLLVTRFDPYLLIAWIGSRSSGLSIGLTLFGLGLMLYFKVRQPLSMVTAILTMGLSLALVAHLGLMHLSPETTPRMVLVLGMAIGLMTLVGGALPVVFTFPKVGVGLAFLFAAFATWFWWNLFESPPAEVELVSTTLISLFLGFDWVRANAIPLCLGYAAEAAGETFLGIFLIPLRLADFIFEKLSA